MGLWVSFNVILQILTKGSLKQEYQSFWKYSTNRADFLWRQKEKRNGFFKVASRRAMEFLGVKPEKDYVLPTYQIPVLTEIGKVNLSWKSFIHKAFSKC